MPCIVAETTGYASQRLGLTFRVMDDQLRIFETASGSLLPTGQEWAARAEREAARADQEAARAEHEAARAEQALEENVQLRRQLEKLQGG